MKAMIKTFSSLTALGLALAVALAASASFGAGSLPAWRRIR